MDKIQTVNERKINDLQERNQKTKDTARNFHYVPDGNSIRRVGAIYRFCQ